MRAWKGITIAAVMTLSASAQSVDAGRRQFVQICAGCHGEDGSGAGHGPNIVDVRNPKAASRDSIRELIRLGLPGRGMPAFYRRGKNWRNRPRRCKIVRGQVVIPAGPSPLARRRRMPSYVIVWENNTLGHSKVSGYTWPGHSSMNIGKEFWYSDTLSTNYVSYWPEKSASLERP